MIVITLTDCPPALRGDLTKWLQEINTSVYVGQVNARVRDELWNRVKKNAKNGRATMVYSARNEQRFDFRVHNSSWEPIDFDGLKLMLRPSLSRQQNLANQRLGFSKAARARKAKQMARNKRTVNPKIDTYIVLDVETTGLSVTDDEIIEIGALMVNKGTVEKQIQFLVKPTKKIDPGIEQLTGITNILLEQEGQEISVVLPKLLNFVRGLPVVSHNADFDYGFIRAACKKLNLPRFSNKRIDTLDLTRRFVKGVKNYKLSTLLEYFNIESTESHRSIDDCVATNQLYLKLIEYEQQEK